METLLQVFQVMAYVGVPILSFGLGAMAMHRHYNKAE